MTMIPMFAGASELLRRANVPSPIDRVIGRWKLPAGNFRTVARRDVVVVLLGCTGAEAARGGRAATGVLLRGMRPGGRAAPREREAVMRATAAARRARKMILARAAPPPLAAPTGLTAASAAPGAPRSPAA